MPSKFPLVDYVVDGLCKEFDQIPPRSFKDLIAAALQLNSFAALKDAHKKGLLNANNIDDIRLGLFKGQYDRAIFEDIPATRAHLDHWCAKCKDPNINKLDTKLFVEAIASLALTYTHAQEDAAIQCEHCGCRQDSLPGDGEMSYITSADDVDENDFIVLCPTCLSEARLARSVLRVHEFDRWFPSLDALYRKGETV